MKIFITGERGELGSFLLSELGRTLSVSTDFSFIKECHILIHTLTRHPSHSNEDVIHSNISYTKKSINSFFDFDKNNLPKFIIFFSTASIYNPQIKTIVRIVLY